MEGTDARKLKKAVVSLRKLELSYQGSSIISKEMMTDSGGSEDTPMGSMDSNVGCTDDDDLEKKIQAFSIPVKPGEISDCASKPAILTSEKKTGSVGKKLIESKARSQSSSSSNAVVKEKVTQATTSSEMEKQGSKLKSGKEKPALGKISKVKVLSDPHKKHTPKVEDVKKFKPEHEKSSRQLQDTDGSQINSLKRKNSVDHKFREPQEKLMKVEKKSITDKPSSSRSSTSQSKSDDSKRLKNIKTDSLKQITKSSDKATGKREGTPVGRSQKLKQNDKELIKESKIVQSTTAKITDSKSLEKSDEKLVLSIAKRSPILRRQSSSDSLVEKNIKQKSCSESDKRDYKKEVSSNGKLESKRSENDLKGNNKSGKTFVSSDRNGRRKDVREKRSEKVSNGKMIKTDLGHSSDLKRVSRPREEQKSTTSKREKRYHSKKDVSKKKHEPERNQKLKDRKHENVLKQKVSHKKSSSTGKQKLISNDLEENINREEENLKPEVYSPKRFLVRQLFKTFSKKADRFPSQNVGTEAYKKLWKWSHYIRLPSDKWSLHKHPKGDFVVILHSEICASLPKVIVDKHVLFCKTALPVVRLYDKEISTLQTPKELQTLGEVCAFLKNIDNLSVCESLRKSIVVGSNGKCGLYTSSKVTLPYTCQHCSRVKATTV